MGYYGHVPEVHGVAPAVAIALAPGSTTVTIGETLTAVASGSPAPTFQWFRGVTPIGGATSSTFVVTAAEVGPPITCHVTNAFGTATSNILQYNPVADPNVFDVMDPASLANGAVGATPWVGLCGVLVAVQADVTKQPVKSATSYNNTPGVTFDGGDVLPISGAGLYMSLISAVSVFLAYFDATGATEIVLEYSPALGQYSFIPNDSGGAGNFEALGSATGWKSTANALAVPQVLGFGFDRNIDRVVSYISIDGVDQALTNRGAPVTPGGLFSSDTLYFGGRGAGAVLGCTGTAGPLLLATSLLTGNAKATVIAYLEWKTTP